MAIWGLESAAHGTEAAPVLGRRKADLAAKQATEEAAVLVAYLVGNSFDR